MWVNRDSKRSSKEAVECAPKSTHFLHPVRQDLIPDDVNSIIGDKSTILYLITIRRDLDTITLILHQTFELPPFKRDYDSAFEKVADILKIYGIVESARNLRFRFILCMQEFFDSIPEEQWKIKDPAFIKESEEFSINKFREWIIEQIT